MNPHESIRTILESPEWVDALCVCCNPVSKHFTLYSCAAAMLPYWQSRFVRDDSMETLVERMFDFAKLTSLKNGQRLKAAIPQRERRHWDLCPPQGLIDENHSNCPADFAGDSIFYAANAMLSDRINDYDDRLALDSAIECLARLLVERDARYDDNKDYPGLASEHLRTLIIETLERIAE